jgi:hypothetical protein
MSRKSAPPQGVHGGAALVHGEGRMGCIPRGCSAEWCMEGRMGLHEAAWAWLFTHAGQHLQLSGLRSVRLSMHGWHGRGMQHAHVLGLARLIRDGAAS